MAAGRKLTASLAVRLTLWYAGSSFIIVIAATSILYWALVTNLDRQDDQFLVDEAHILEDLLAERPEYVEAIRQEIEWEAAARRYARIYVRLLDADGATIAQTPKMQNVLPVSIFPEPTAPTMLTGGQDRWSIDGMPYRVITANYSRSSPSEVRIIQIGMDRVQQQELIVSYRLTLVVVLLSSLIITSVAAYIIAKRGMRPITEVTETARRVRSTTLHERIETGDVPSELTALVDTFNEMLDRLQESFERLSRFSADIAHELRTPVNNIRGEAEVTLSKSRTVDEYHESLLSCLEETVRLGRIIDNLLLLARSESSSFGFQRDCLNLSDELQRVREFYGVLTSENDLDFIVESVPDLELAANRSLLQRAIGNLVENSIAYSPNGGTIAISAFRQSELVIIEVADDGKGIPAEDLPHIFDRFYRVKKDRSIDSGGSGLGLAIVRSIIELHGGSVKIYSSLGYGTTVTLALPMDRCK